MLIDFNFFLTQAVISMSEKTSLWRWLGCVWGIAFMPYSFNRAYHHVWAKGCSKELWAGTRQAFLRWNKYPASGWQTQLSPKKTSTVRNKMVDVQAAGLPVSSCQLGLQGACARKEAKVSHSHMSTRPVGHLGEALKTENINECYKSWIRCSAVRSVCACEVNKQWYFVVSSIHLHLWLMVLPCEDSHQQARASVHCTTDNDSSSLPLGVHERYARVPLHLILLSVYFLLACRAFDKCP